MANTNLGRVSLVPRGVYDPAAAYERLDLVRHEGEGYVVLRSVTGVTPVDGADYMLLAGKGADSDMLAADYDPQGKKTDVYLYTDEAIQGLKDNPYLTGGISVATTYTPEGGVDGVDYAVEVPSINEPYPGMLLPIIFHKTSRTPEPHLRFNGGPATQIIRSSSTSSGVISVGGGSTWLTQNVPTLLQFSSLSTSSKRWRAISQTQPVASDLRGVVKPANGGTGLDAIPAGAYLVGGADSESQMEVKTPTEVRTDIGAAKLTDAPVTLTASGWTGEGPYQQTVTVEGLTDTGSIAPAEGLTTEQRQAARAACIGVLSKDVTAKTLTVVADGVKPTVDIPAVVTIVS